MFPLLEVSGLSIMVKEWGSGVKLLHSNPSLC